MLEQITAWDASARTLQRGFTCVPGAAGRIAATPSTIAWPKINGTVLIHWQPARTH
jgi:hypothetical protein